MGSTAQGTVSIAVVVIMGVSGSGKSTVGRALAEAVGGRFHDADDFHSDRNIDKMSRSEPLTEADRAPWLAALREAIDRWLTEAGVDVLACSALTYDSRRRLGVERDAVALVYLRGDRNLIARRMRGREHFMPPELLDSQFATLEPPRDALVLDAAEPVGALVARIRAELEL